MSLQKGFRTMLCLARATWVRIPFRQNLIQTIQTDVVTFLVVFFSYCKYRDSTTLPPAGDTLMV